MIDMDVVMTLHVPAKVLYNVRVVMRFLWHGVIHWLTATSYDKFYFQVKQKKKKKNAHLILSEWTWNINYTNVKYVETFNCRRTYLNQLYSR